MLAQEDHLLGTGEDRRPVGEAGLKGVVAQQPIAPGVEGADHGVGVAVRDEPVDPLGHLERGPIREGEGQDLRRLRPLLGDQPCDPARDDRGLAGPRAGDDQQRSLAVRHRLALARSQVGEQRRLDAQVRARRRPRRRDQLLEDRDLVRGRHHRWHLTDGSRGAIHRTVIARLLDTSSVAFGIEPWRRIASAWRRVVPSASRTNRTESGPSAARRSSSLADLGPAARAGSRSSDRPRPGRRLRAAARRARRGSPAGRRRLRRAVASPRRHAARARSCSTRSRMIGSSAGARSARLTRCPSRRSSPDATRSSTTARSSTSVRVSAWRPRCALGRGGSAARRSAISRSTRRSGRSGSRR